MERLYYAAKDRDEMIAGRPFAIAHRDIQKGELVGADVSGLFLKKTFDVEEDMETEDLSDLDPLYEAVPPVEEDPLETDHMPTARQARRDAKHKIIKATHRERMAEILDRLPEPGETFHIVSNGTFDHFDFVPRIAELMDGVGSFYGSTWTMSRPNALDLLELYDQGKIGEITLATGLYFKRRETAVYATILEGLQKRGQRYISAKNHCKVSCFAPKFRWDGNPQPLDPAEPAEPDWGCWISVEGSANYTANPRMENFTVTNSKKVFDLHVGWIEELLNG